MLGMRSTASSWVAESSKMSHRESTAQRLIGGRLLARVEIQGDQHQAVGGVRKGVRAGRIRREVGRAAGEDRGVPVQKLDALVGEVVPGEDQARCVGTAWVGVEDLDGPAALLGRQGGDMPGQVDPGHLGPSGAGYPGSLSIHVGLQQGGGWSRPVRRCQGRPRRVTIHQAGICVLAGGGGLPA
jgi:hypothetical protein